MSTPSNFAVINNFKNVNNNNLSDQEINAIHSGRNYSDISGSTGSNAGIQQQSRVILKNTPTSLNLLKNKTVIDLTGDEDPLSFIQEIDLNVVESLSNVMDDNLFDELEQTIDTKQPNDSTFENANNNNLSEQELDDIHNKINISSNINPKKRSSEEIDINEPQAKFQRLNSQSDGAVPSTKERVNSLFDDYTFNMLNSSSHFESPQQLSSYIKTIREEEGKAPQLEPNANIKTITEFFQNEKYAYYGTVNSNNVPDGQGNELIAETLSYSGGYRNGLRQGIGTLTLPNSTYYGAFLDGVPNGMGIAQNKRYSYYGHFKKGKPHHVGFLHLKGKERQVVIHTNGELVAVLNEKEIPPTGKIEKLPNPSTREFVVKKQSGQVMYCFRGQKKFYNDGSDAFSKYYLVNGGLGLRKIIERNQEINIDKFGNFILMYKDSAFLKMNSLYDFNKNTLTVNDKRFDGCENYVKKMNVEVQPSCVSFNPEGKVYAQLYQNKSKPSWYFGMIISHVDDSIYFGEIENGAASGVGLTNFYRKNGTGYSVSTCFGAYRNGDKVSILELDSEKKSIIWKEKKGEFSFCSNGFVNKLNKNDIIIRTNFNNSHDDVTNKLDLNIPGQQPYSETVIEQIKEFRKNGLSLKANLNGECTFTLYDNGDEIETVKDLNSAFIKKWGAIISRSLDK